MFSATTEYPGDDVARRAFEIMPRRQWTVTQWGYGESTGRWGVTTFKGNWPRELLGMGPLLNQEADPFTALVRADEWLTDKESGDFTDDELVRMQQEKCDAVGPHHGDRCNGGRVQSPNAQFTRECEVCKGTGIKESKCGGSLKTSRS